jgi:hypothetical protein
MRSHAIETVERSLLLRIASEHAHVHAHVAKIGADLSARDRDEADDAGILCRFGEEGGYLDADRFGDTVRSTRVTQKRPPPKSASEPPALCGSTRARHLL